ncbi:MAG: hypothetical protein GY803_26230 [Chloroflexi bacterium]|nr:hypothetical protein [Chloroflexota bacterium]
MKVRRNSKRMNPFARMLLGVLVMLGAFVLLWTNEGRVNLADVAKKSEQTSAESVNPALEGEFVGVTGRLETAVPVNDDLYLRPAEFVQLNRWVEMYAWVEDEETDEGNTNYTYEMMWTNDPRSAEEFYYPEGRSNPLMPVYDATFTAEAATIGDYQINPLQMTLPKPETLPLSAQNVQEGPYRIGEEYIFEGKGTLDNPKLGDVRASFTGVPSGIAVTAFGKQTGIEITAYVHREKTELYRALAGNRDQAILKLNTEYKNLLWGFRVMGFMMTWAGLGLLASPLTSLLRFVPVLGNLGRKAIGAVTFVLALLLAGLTSAVSALAHNVWAMLFLLALLLGGGFYWQRRNQEKAPH